MGLARGDKRDGDEKGVKTWRQCKYVTPIEAEGSVSLEFPLTFPPVAFYHAPAWMSGLISEIRTNNQKISAMEVSMKTELDNMKTSLQVHDANVIALNNRVVELEKVSKGSITEAVTAAVDAKLQCIQSQIDTLQPVLKRIRSLHYEYLVSRYGHLMQDAVPYFHAVSQSYKITFKTLVAAKLFQQTVNQDLLSGSDKWTQDMRLGVNGFKGTVQLISDEDVWILVDLVANARMGGTVYDFQPNISNLEYFGVSAEQFNTIVEQAAAAAAWPDGIPYSSWRASGDIGKKVLYDLYLHLMQQGTLPGRFNECTAAFLPKGSALLGHESARQPASTRPLSLSNCDNKLLSSAIAVPIAKVAEDKVDKAQRGFIKGRQMLDNIVEVDSNLTIWSAMCGCKNAGSALFDLKAAFPSIHHMFIWACLRALGIPEFVIAAIIALYKDCVMYIVFAGSRKHFILVERGVKQGCPLSGIIFSICFDPVVRRLKEIAYRIPVVLNAFADDLSVTSSDLIGVLPQLLRLLCQAGLGSGLILNLSKCQLIFPHYHTFLNAVELCKAQGVRIRKFIIGQNGWYLGVGVGIGACDRSWAPVLIHLKERSLRVKSLKQGLSISVQAYNTYAVTVAGHCAQDQLQMRASILLSPDQVTVIDHTRRRARVERLRRASTRAMRGDGGGPGLLVGTSPAAASSAPPPAAGAVVESTAVHKAQLPDGTKLLNGLRVLQKIGEGAYAKVRGRGVDKCCQRTAGPCLGPGLAGSRPRPGHEATATNPRRRFVQNHRLADRSAETPAGR
ncbi:unnamed protein product [Prorocentrum cordatum]|uniref:Reverse transcriptase domain-containing protein n=1 Tax=Prorocentrum cordatum TaxID=2364126 RepID=A0ABN9WI52_9DINO|nr:unnamed protein product [Polarella glacialis]